MNKTHIKGKILLSNNSLFSISIPVLVLSQLNWEPKWKTIVIYTVLWVLLPQCIMQITKPKWLLHCKGTIKYIRKQWTWPKLGCSISLHVCPFIHIPGASHWLRFIELYNSTPKRLPVSHWLRFVVVYIGEYFSSPIRVFFISYAQYHSRTLNFSKINFVQIYITVLIILVSILSKRANTFITQILRSN